MNKVKDNFNLEILSGYTYQPLDNGQILEIETENGINSYKLNGIKINVENNEGNK